MSSSPDKTLAIECPVVQRSSMNQATKTFVSNFDVVVAGVVVANESSLTIYEATEYKEAGTFASSKLVIPFSSVLKVKGKRIVSTHGNYEAGRIQIFGQFDAKRGFERITMKLHPDKFCILKVELTKYIGHSVEQMI